MILVLNEWFDMKIESCLFTSFWHCSRVFHTAVILEKWYSRTAVVDALCMRACPRWMALGYHGPDGCILKQNRVKCIECCFSNFTFFIYFSFIAEPVSSAINWTANMLSTWLACSMQSFHMCYFDLMLSLAFLFTADRSLLSEFRALIAGVIWTNRRLIDSPVKCAVNYHALDSFWVDVRWAVLQWTESNYWTCLCYTRSDCELLIPVAMGACFNKTDAVKNIIIL